MSEGPVWERLTVSSKAAVRFAWAAAALRLGQLGPATDQVDATDLLVGILAAHPRDSEPRQLCEHFEIPLGALVRRDGRRRFTSRELVAAVEALEDQPWLGGEAEDVLARAADLPADPEGLIPLKNLFGPLLESGDVHLALGRALRQRGVAMSRVLELYRDYLGQHSPYETFLKERLPYTPGPLQLPSYRADEPGSRRGAADQPEPADYVDIQSEVDAFAYLIASTRLVPPLALGLFGDWGSGKSFFLRSVQRRVDGLINDPRAKRRAQRELPFFKSVVQIEFNAWQYVEGNLWASLLEHLFRNLRISADDGDDLLAERRKYWIEQIQEATGEQTDAQARRDRLELERQAAAARVEQQLQATKARQAELEQRRRSRTFQTWEPPDALRRQAIEAASRAGVPAVARQAGELHQALVEARQTLRDSGPILALLRGWGRQQVAAVILVPLVTLILVVALQHLDLSAAAAASASFFGFLATLTGIVRLGNGYLRSSLDHIAAAEAALKKELEGDAEETARAEQALAKAEEALAHAYEEEKRIAAELEAKRSALEATTPTQVLNDFITNRLGSDDYRRHLGVPALVRRDLEQLSRLVAAQNEILLGTPSDTDAAPTNLSPDTSINRIVLYIDDLDRCPAQLVISVLQAVHLLLAFPLFVVVVAVDARWLAGALRSHYGELLEDSATPNDYVEKIFQVPFWVEPMTAASRRRMARGLLEPTVTAGASSAVNGEDSPEDVTPSAGDPALEPLVDSLWAADPPPPAWLEAADLTSTPDELAFVDEVAPLLGATPRGVKRFVNVYQLVKSIGRSRGLFDSTRDPPDHEHLMLALAVVSNQEDVAVPFFDALDQGGQVTDGLNVARRAFPGGDWGPLDRWLAAHPRLAAADAAELGRWAPLARRFSFRALSATEGTGPDPPDDGLAGRNPQGPA